MEFEDHRHSPRYPRTPTSVDDCTDTTGASHSHGTYAKGGVPTSYPSAPQGFPGISPPSTYHPIRAPPSTSPQSHSNPSNRPSCLRPSLSPRK
ncbi:hypothetical protein CDL15_Pgr006071 [Punica granatum]|uniref:Uncharacterized protein n=1 Tax=Punica granatum TaxID=22663 RepID=A0A218VU49_PUNGR|nr:hypothetical protein CDL15_Pgr006071 [Punica granatum]